MLAVLAASVFPAFAQLQATSQEQMDGCVRVLRHGINPERGGVDLAVLSALRELGDASLKPLWFQLAQQNRWEAQVHAVLALSELTPANPADAWMIAQLKSVDAQRAVIATLLDRKALSAEQSRKLLESEALLEPVTKLWLIADLVSRGETVDTAMIQSVVAGTDLDLAGLAACLLAHLGDTSALEKHKEKIAATESAWRDRHLMELLIAIEQYKLTGALDWAATLAEEMTTERAVKWQAVRALLTLAPEKGLMAWKRRASEITSNGEWMRAVLLLLDEGPIVPAETYGVVPRDNELLAAMANLGVAMSTKQPAAPATIALIDLGHIATSRWALGNAEELGADDARAVYLHVLDSLEQTRVGKDERAEMAVLATEFLYKLDPAAALDYLVKLPDDCLTQEVMLLALMRCDGADIGAAAKKLRRIGSSRADSLTLILAARHTDTLTEAEIKQLGLIAASGTQLAPALQAQAAWLYLKHTGKIEQALNRIFPKS